MKFASYSCLVVASVCLSPAPSRAGSNYNFIVSGPGVNATGTLNAKPNNNGTYSVTSGTGLVWGSSLTTAQQGTMNIVPNPSGTNYSYYQNSQLNFDDQIKPSAPQYLDYYGLMFTMANGTIVNIFGLSPTQYTFVEEVAGVQSYSGVSFELSSAVPEPSSLTLLATAVVPGLGYWWARRRRRALA